MFVTYLFRHEFLGRQKVETKQKRITSKIPAKLQGEMLTKHLYLCHQHNNYHLWY